MGPDQRDLRRRCRADEFTLVPVVRYAIASICLFVYMCICVLLSAYLSAYLSVYYIYMSVSISMYVSIYICLSICRAICSWLDTNSCSCCVLTQLWNHPRLLSSHQHKPTTADPLLAGLLQPGRSARPRTRPPPRPSSGSPRRRPRPRCLCEATGLEEVG